MEEILAKDTISFQAEGRLLQELGLRLVASPEVALVELIKNSYDADSPTCTVRLAEEDATLVVQDSGHGMSFEDFKTKWMRIATSSKVQQEFSPRFRRRLTGAKGIGRFAVRYLGDYLVLQSIAYDPSRKCKTRLTATFDWPRLDMVTDISKSSVSYELARVPDSTSSGTTLTIRRLRNSADFARTKGLRDNVLRIVTPIQGLDRGPFAENDASQEHDPGFRVILPGETEEQDINLAELVLSSFWARLTVHLEDDALRFEVSFPDQKRPKTLNLRVKNSISEGFFADIRYFPRRKGIFQRKGFNGQKAWRWVRDNCGVKVVDHGFHIHPYGFENDDWLRLDRDKAHSKRDWETAIAKKHFPLTQFEKTDPASNPVLYLPYNFQVVGAVFLRTRRNLGGKDQTDLVPAMDREGLLENDAFAELREYVRAGVEFLAHEDKAELDRQAEAEAAEAARTAREEIKEAIEYVQKIPTLSPPDKARVIKHYRNISERLEEQEEYSAQSRRSLVTMGLLGVVAGFMMHESKAVIHDLAQAVSQVNALSRKFPELEDISRQLAQRLGNFEGYVNYVKRFVENVRTPKDLPLPAAGQVRHIVNHFRAFADEHGIKVTCQIENDVKTPPLPVTVYSGVLLNLYTNALKAVVAGHSGLHDPQVTLRAWNERDKHIVEVADNGIGVPPHLRKRIWEPLYTTTSDAGNPLGSGMGLGLTLVKQVVTELGGTVSLMKEPPPGFTTCFRVVLPQNAK